MVIRINNACRLPLHTQQLIAGENTSDVTAWSYTTIIAFCNEFCSKKPVVAEWSSLHEHYEDTGL